MLLILFLSYKSFSISIGRFDSVHASEHSSQMLCYKCIYWNVTRMYWTPSRRLYTQRTQSAQRCFIYIHHMPIITNRNAFHSTHSDEFWLTVWSCYSRWVKNVDEWNAFNSVDEMVCYEFERFLLSNKCRIYRIMMIFKALLVVSGPVFNNHCDKLHYLL